MVNTRIQKTESELLTELIENAFDFFNKSIDEYNSQPKYALLHLAISVELFIKSRLMKEHWSLIFENDPNITKLRCGDFKSVALKDAIKRINSVLPSAEHIQKDVEKVLGNLSDRRNLIAHFCHPTEKVNSNEVLIEQANIWYHLRKLLDQTWSSTFANYSVKLTDLSNKMMRQATYLDVIFQEPEIQGKISSGKANGKNVCSCPACKHDSVIMEMQTGHLGEGKCLVCHHELLGIMFKCDAIGCNRENILYSGYSTKCGCGKTWDRTGVESLEFLKKKVANCSDCGGNDSVFLVDDKNYLCISCFSTYSEIHQCEWCGEYYIGEYDDDTYSNGCCNYLCEGNVSYQCSKND